MNCSPTTSTSWIFCAGSARSSPKSIPRWRIVWCWRQNGCGRSPCRAPAGRLRISRRARAPAHRRRFSGNLGIAAEHPVPALHPADSVDDRRRISSRSERRQDDGGVQGGGGFGAVFAARGRGPVQISNLARPDDVPAHGGRGAMASARPASPGSACPGCRRDLPAEALLFAGRAVQDAAAVESPALSER